MTSPRSFVVNMLIIWAMALIVHVTADQAAEPEMIASAPGDDAVQSNRMLSSLSRARRDAEEGLADDKTAAFEPEMKRYLGSQKLAFRSDLGKKRLAPASTAARRYASFRTDFGKRSPFKLIPSVSASKENLKRFNSFRSDLGQRYSSFRSDLGKRSEEVHDVNEDEAEAAALGDGDDVELDKVEGDEKRFASFRSDLGKRRLTNSAFRSDLGK